MAAPTQEYPPWLTAVPTTIYAPDGSPLTTATEVLYLPLTYYGPSIPLGPEWTYGGLTSPASTSSVMQTTTSTSMPVTTSTNPTAIPSTSSMATPSSSTSVATSTSSIPSSSISSPSSISPSSTSPTPSSTSAAPTAAATNGLSRAQLIGVIIASILGVIFLFILALLLLLCIRRRRSGKRGSPYDTLRDESFTWVTPWVAPDGRLLGEGSPRTSGEERDAFLQRSRSSGPDTELGGRPPYEGIARVPVPHDSHSSGSVSSYGAVLEKPTLQLRPETPPFDYSNARGKILSDEELRRIEAEDMIPGKEEKEEDDPLLLPPPRLVDPARGAAMPGALFRSPQHETSQTSLGQYPDADEPATVLNARRVRVDELGSVRHPPQLPRPVEGSASSKSTNGFLNSLGLNRLSKLMNFGSVGRKSWGPEEGEAGQSLLGRREMVEKPEPGPSKRPFLGLGLIDGERPRSGYSSKSNGTVYYDARSSFRATPTLTNTPPTPLPRALTPNLPPWGSGSSRGSHVPPVPPLPSPSPAAGETHDVLDEPAPAAVSPFSNSASVPSLRDTATVVTASDRTYYPFPPGLDGVRAKSWGSSPPRSPNSQSFHPVSSFGSQGQSFHPVSSLGSQVQSFHPVSSLGTNAGISIDVLEEEPPRAAAHWRELSETTQHERRGTFGQRVPMTPATPTEFAEVGSLYSDGDRLDPRAGSRRDLSGSQGSNSSNGRSVRTANTENSQASDASGPWLMAPPPAHIFGRPFSSEWTGAESDVAEPPTSARDRDRDNDHDWTLGLR